MPTYRQTYGHTYRQTRLTTRLRGAHSGSPQILHMYTCKCIAHSPTSFHLPALHPTSNSKFTNSCRLPVTELYPHNSCRYGSL